MITRLPAVLALVFLLTGCQPPQPIVPEVLLPEPISNDQPVPTYQELVERYNRTLRPLDRLWAEARVDLDWINEKGDRKHEHGDGKFMFVRPNRVALQIEEFGKGFWAGADGLHYWLFELADTRTAYVGRFDRLDQHDTDTFPLPVRPTDLLYVLGLKPIDPTLVPSEPAVERVAGHYLIEPPGLGLRLLLHPETARPVRVDILNPRGESVVKCVLSETVPVRNKEGETAVGRIASQVEVYVLGREARMTLQLKQPEVGSSRIRDVHFDFDTLMKVYKPDRVVDLDAEISP